MEQIDLHVHSTASDGTLSPREVVDLALKTGLKAIALTDHDTVEGLKEAIPYAREKGLLLIPGIEVSAVYHQQEVHILGLQLQPSSPAFLAHIQKMQQTRTERNLQIIARMQKGGIAISPEMMREKFGPAILTRAHFARFLLDEGYVGSVKEAFDRYMGVGCPFYLPKAEVSPGEALELIREGAGKSVLAHPLLYHLAPTELEALVVVLQEQGLWGLEVYYSSHTQSDVRYLTQLARRHGLEMTGGSDFHGSNKPAIALGTGYGRLLVPEALLEPLLK